MALVLALGTIPASQVSGLPSPVPVLTLDLTPIQQTVHINCTLNDAVMFGGNATVELGFQMQRVTVTLSSSCIWPTCLSPTELEFTRSETQMFYVTVTVPPGTSSLEVGQLTVLGMAKAPGMPTSTGQANAVVTVAQYYGLELDARNNTLTGVIPGGTTSGRFTIKNAGNGLDSFRIALNDPRGVVSIYSGRPGVDVKGNESAAVDFTLTVSPNATYGTGTIVIVSFKVTSVEAENSGIALTRTIAFSLVFGPASPTEPDKPGAPDGNETAVPDGDSGGGGGEAATAMAIVAAVVLVVAAVVLATRRRERVPSEADEVPLEVEPAHVQA